MCPASKTAGCGRSSNRRQSDTDCSLPRSASCACRRAMAGLISLITSSVSRNRYAFAHAPRIQDALVPLANGSCDIAAAVRRGKGQSICRRVDLMSAAGRSSPPVADVRAPTSHDWPLPRRTAAALCDVVSSLEEVVNSSHRETSEVALAMPLLPMVLRALNVQCFGRSGGIPA